MDKLILTLSRIAPLLILLALVPNRTAAQLVVKPTRIIIGSSNATQELTLQNGADEPLVVDIRMMFGLWRIDSTGKFFLDSTGTPEELARSCSDWVRVFPKQLTLGPGATRKVRLLVTAPAGIPAGEYTARLMVTSQTVGLPSAPKPASAESITGTLKSIISLSLEVMYRKGSCQTGIELGDLQMHRGKALVDIRPVGNAIYRGTLFGTIRTADGTVADSATHRIIAAIPQRLNLWFRQLDPGAYRLTLESRAELPGSASEAVIPSPTVRKEYDMVVNDTDITVTPRVE